MQPGHIRAALTTDLIIAPPSKFVNTCLQILAFEYYQCAGRYSPPSPDEQARRPSGGVCEPDFLTLRVEKHGLNRGDTAKAKKGV